MDEVLVDLCAKGWIAFFRSTWDEGYNADLASVDFLEPDELAAELAFSSHHGETIFFTETEAGARIRQARPG